MAKLPLSLLFLAAMGCVLMARPTNAFDHIVGGSFGWDVPNITSFYQEWAKPRTFGVGDKLVFPYRTGVHNILEVTEKEFNGCTQEKPIDMLYEGPTVLNLTNKGNFYYYCGVGTHCEAGQKLSIIVTTDGPGSSGAPFNSAEAPAPALGASANATKSSTNSIIHKNFGLASGLVYLVVSMFIIRDVV